jgi:hypothetical protein
MRLFFNGSASIHDRLAWEDSRIYNSAHIWNQGKVAVQRTEVSKASADIVLIHDTIFNYRYIGPNKHRALNSGTPSATKSGSLVEPAFMRSPIPAKGAPTLRERKSAGGMA